MSEEEPVTLPSETPVVPAVPNAAEVPEEASLAGLLSPGERETVKDLSLLRAASAIAD